MITNKHLITKTHDEMVVDQEESAKLAKLTAAMAHEVRNPLTTIKGFLQLLKPHLKDINKEEYALIALDEIDRVNEIIYDFLNIVKPPQTKKTSSCINDLIIYIVKLYECESIIKNVKMITNLTSEKVTVNMNKNEIKQVLINLIKNGFEAIEDGRSTEGKIEINTEVSGNYIYIHIIDNGCGMSCETAAHLFTPFYSTKSKGSGMGLSICHKIIRDHLGRIFCSSTKNIGTKFTIELPIYQK
jgi:signal transduction histidine kinase